MRKLYRKIRTPRGAIRFVSMVNAQGRAIEDVETARHFRRARDAQQFADQALTRRALRVVQIVEQDKTLSDGETSIDQQ